MLERVRLQGRRASNTMRSGLPSCVALTNGPQLRMAACLTAAKATARVAAAAAAALPLRACAKRALAPTSLTCCLCKAPCMCAAAAPFPTIGSKPPHHTAAAPQAARKAAVAAAARTAAARKAATAAAATMAVGQPATRAAAAMAEAAVAAAALPQFRGDDLGRCQRRAGCYSYCSCQIRLGARGRSCGCPAGRQLHRWMTERLR
mmetsp:Transcript_30921/g.91981  ORF Transcript_30921/g.91981 Transcript_30921/m.91981 type:complete len:205 (+) Transcript_30921:1203-1817(+)